MFLKPKELEKFYNTNNIGKDKENPKINKLDIKYKMAIYLGYSLKWNSDYQYDRWDFEKSKEDRYNWHLTPFFKKSRETFDFNFYSNTWNFFMREMLPKLKEDGFVSNKLNEYILNSDLDNVEKETIKILDKKIKDIKNPFINVKEFVREI